MTKLKIETPAGPRAIGTYSQAIQAGKTVYLSGQIPLDPTTMRLVSDDFEAQARQVMTNLRAVCEASGGDIDAVVKLTIYLTNLAHFPILNEVMASFFQEPYPARTTIEISALPKEAKIEMDAIMVLE